MTHDALQQVREFQSSVDQATRSAVTSARRGHMGGAVFLALLAVAGCAGVLVGGVPVSIGASIAVVCALAAAGLLRLASRLRRPEELAQRGLRATATFEQVTGGGLALHVTNREMSGTIAQTRSRFVVAVEGRAPYTVEVTDFVPSTATGRLVAGARFAAWVDPTRPERVLVDWGS